MVQFKVALLTFLNHMALMQVEFILISLICQGLMWDGIEKHLLDKIVISFLLNYDENPITSINKNK